MGSQFQHIRNQAAVIRLGMADDDVVDSLRVNFPGQGLQVQFFKLGVGGIHQSHLLAANDKGVIGGAVLQAELNVKSGPGPSPGSE